MKSEIEILIDRFIKNQSLSLLQELKNKGIGLKILKNNKWERLSEYKLPLERMVLLYGDDFKPSDLGVY